MTGRGMDGLLLLFFSLFSSSLASSNEDPCAGLSEVHDAASILKKKDMDREGLAELKVYESEGFVYQWMWLRSGQVMGLDGQTVEDVMTVLDYAQCSFVPWGDAVWMSLRSLRPTTIQGDVLCPIEEMEKECNERLGLGACTLVSERNSSTGVSYLQIGRNEEPQNPGAVQVDPIRVYARDSMWLMPPDHFTFTADGLATIDSLDGMIYVVDVTGRGVMDVCDRQLTADMAIAPVIPDHLLRYFELRSFDFRPAAEELRLFIQSELRNGSMAIDQEDWRHWYCESDLLKGFAEKTGGDGDAFICLYEELKGSEKKRLMAAKELMQVDTPFLYKEVIEPGMESLEVSSLTTAQFNLKKYGVERRQRVLIQEMSSVSEGEIRRDEEQGDAVSEPGQHVPLLDYDTVVAISRSRSLSFIAITVTVIASWPIFA